jgi:hypothetical protein
LCRGTVPRFEHPPLLMHKRWAQLFPGQFVYLIGILGLGITIASCAGGQKLNADYKFNYRFQLDNQGDSSTIEIENETKTLKMDKLLPQWYNINSRRELTDNEIEQIKKCVASDIKDVTKCKERNVYYVTIEI